MGLQRRGQERTERTAAAIGLGLAAEMLAGMDEQRVVFVEELWVGGKGGLEELTDVLVGLRAMSQAVAFEDAPGVGVDHEDGVVAGVEKDGVSGLRSNAVDGKQLLAQFDGWRREEPMERALVVDAKKCDEGFELASFLAEVAGRADQRGEAGERNAFDRGGSEQAFEAKIGDGAFDVGPAGVLGENSADDDFETSAAGPPELGAVGGQHGFEVRSELVIDGGVRVRVRRKAGAAARIAEWRGSRQNAGGRHRHSQDNGGVAASQE